MTVPIIRSDLSSDELRAAAARCKDAAAAMCGMDRQTLRDWVHRYNADGLAGLANHPIGGGPSCALSEAQQAELTAWVEAGPDVKQDGIVRWRQRDLRQRVAERFGVHLHERSIGKVLHRLGFSHISVRPRHPKPTPRRSRRIKIFPHLVADAIPDAARGKPLELWWQDEARVGQQGTLTYIWARQGSRPPALRDQRRKWAYIFGAVCPERDKGAALVLPKANAQAMNLHLAEISSQVRPGAHAVLILDRAGWHRTGGKLRLPDNISLLYLPPYSPELNPTENVWQFLRQNFLSNRVYASYKAIVDAGCDAWNALLAQSGRLASITTREWAKTVTS